MKPTVKEIEDLSIKYQSSLNDISIVLNENCNLKCLYCNAKSTYSPITKLSTNVIESIYKYIPYMYEKVLSSNKDYNMNLVGGEPGLLPDDILDLILNYKIDDLMTNGTILKRDQFIKNIHNINLVTYHIAPDIKPDMFITKVEGANVAYLVVAHRLNISILKPFLEFNPHIEFEVVINNATYFDNINHLRTMLKFEDLVKINQIIQDIKNVTPISKERILRMVNNQVDNTTQEILEVKTLCHHKKHILFTFPSNAIMPCKTCYKGFLSFNSINKETIDISIDCKKEDIVDFDKHCGNCRIYLDSIIS